MNFNHLYPWQSDDTSPIRVLMADPDKALQSAYREPFAKKGFELVPASTGLECLERLDECSPSALVLEPLLPWGGCDGILAVMGESPGMATIPVMVFTSCRDSEILNQVARFPVHGYCLKRLSPEALAARLHDVLSQRKTAFPLTEQTGRIEYLIARRTNGRVKDLQVTNVDGHVLVRGKTDSPHFKRLAMSVVLEAFKASPFQSERVDVGINVCGNER